MSERQVFRSSAGFTVALAVLALACSSGAPVASAALVCRDPATNQCLACPGTGVCVDPIACTVLPCQPTDVRFQPPDVSADTADTAADDAADAIAELPDAAPDLEDAPDVAPPDTAPDLPETADTADATGCPDPCPAFNLVECLPGVAAVRTCQLSGTCLSWGMPIACKPGETCASGQCQPPAATCNPPCTNGKVCQGGQCVPATTGTLSCAQVTGCLGQCAVGATACEDLCLSQGTAAAQAQVAALDTCITATCKAIYDSGKYFETMLCLYTSCGSEQVACMGSGSGTCAGLNTCLGSCGTSAVCSNNCHVQASLQGATDYYGLMACVELKCAARTGGALDACAQSYCSAQWQKCFGSAPSGLSCQGILACAGKCTTKECAQACKAKGTTAAQAQIDALVQCQTQKCGNACQFDSPACTTCMNDWCAAAQNACT